MASTQSILGGLLGDLLGTIDAAAGSGTGEQLANLVPSDALDALTSELDQAGDGGAMPLVDQLLGAHLIDPGTVESVANGSDPDLSALQGVLGGDTVPVSDVQAALDALFPAGSDGIVDLGALDGLASDTLGAVQTVLSDIGGILAGGGNDGGALDVLLSGNDEITGTAKADTLHGGDGNDTIVGGGGNDTLSGDAGNDHLYGQWGRDHLNGGAGNDVLDGGAGGDVMAGGAGNDVYIVADPGDRVAEGVNGGTDWVRAEISYRLPTNVENLSLIGNALNGTGNAAANTLVGNAGTNHLAGWGGNDTIKGWGGDDVLNGNAGNDRVNGNAGNDQIAGGRGNDVLTGGAGHDVFVFANALVPSNADRITDFSHGVDKIGLNAAEFGAIGARLDASEFVDGLRAADANDHIIYHEATGALFYDPDGVGGHGGIHFATVEANAHLSAADFMVL